MSSFDAMMKLMELVNRLRRMVPDGSPEIRKMEDEIRWCSLMVNDYHRQIIQDWVSSGFGEYPTPRYIYCNAEIGD